MMLACNTAKAANSYHTTFPLTENPISEGGNWINAAAAGSSGFSNVTTTPGLAHGAQASAGTPPPYIDSTAVLTGTWARAQTVQGTIHVISASGSATVFEEVELRLLTTVTSTQVTGYEINCSITTSHSYLELVRWDAGATSGNFAILAMDTSHPCVDGDVIRASVTSAGAFTVTLNGTTILTATDTTYTTGSPGVGFFLQGGATGLQSNYGLSSFSADDAQGSGGGRVAPSVSIGSKQQPL